MAPRQRILFTTRLFETNYLTCVDKNTLRLCEVPDFKVQPEPLPSP